jgi:hypothetical protein
MIDNTFWKKTSPGRSVIWTKGKVNVKTDFFFPQNV